MGPRPGWVTETSAKATTTAMRHRKRRADDLRVVVATAAECRDPVSRRVPRKRVRNMRRKFDARVGALVKRKMVHRPPIKKLWINGNVSEDREEWMEEVSAHCELNPAVLHHQQ